MNVPAHESALPDYDEKRSYSESDMQHIVARRLAAIQLEQLAQGQIELRREMLAEIAELKASVKELVDAWNTAGGMIRIVKYVAGAVTSLLVLIALYKSGWGGK